MLRRNSVTGLDAAAKKAGKGEGGLNHPADGTSPPPTERAIVGLAHHQVALVQAGGAVRLATMQAATDALAPEVELREKQTAASAAKSAEAKRVLDATEPAPSALFATIRYFVLQLILGAVDAYGLSLAYYLFSAIQPWESLLMAGGLAAGLGAVADWMGSGRARENLVLAYVAAAAVVGVFAATGYIRGVYFGAKHTLIAGVHGNPLLLAAALSGTGFAVFVFTSVVANTYHRDEEKRRVWAWARRQNRRAEKELQRCQARELAAKKRHAQLASALAHEPARQQAEHRAWLSRIGIVAINHYRAAFLRATGDGRPRPWMSTDPNLTVDLRAAITQNPVRDFEGEAALAPVVETNRVLSRNGTGVGKVVGAALLVAFTLLNGCGRNRGNDYVVLFDVSDNGWPSSVQEGYMRDTRTLIASLNKGDCIAFDVIHARADDQQFPVSGCLAPNTNNPLAVAEQRELLRDSLLTGVTTLLQHAPRSPNSPLAEAVAATPHRFATHPDMHHIVVVLTDGVQQGDLVDLAAHAPTPAYIDSALTRMREAGGIADLYGNRLRIATVGGGEYDRLPQERHRAIKNWWVRYAAAANATMDPDADYGPLTGN